MRSRFSRRSCLQVSYIFITYYEKLRDIPHALSVLGKRVMEVVNGKCSSRVKFSQNLATFELTLTFSDPEISEECLSVCRLDYLTCRQNCNSQSCESTCVAVYAGYLII